MGGGSSAPTQQPYDELGGQFASFSGGTPLPNYAALGSGAGQGISRGFQQYGAGLSQQPTISANGSISQPFTLPTQQQSAAIPIEGQGAEQQIQEILKILQSILGSQGGT